MSVRIAVVVARFNVEITEGLLAGAHDAFRERGLGPADVTVLNVPGAFEIPVTAMRLAETGAYDAIVCLGCLIKGDTMHFEYIAEATSRGIMDVSLATALPVTFGVLTTTSEAQAIERSRPDSANKGREAALAAMEMAELFRQLPPTQGQDVGQ